MSSSREREEKKMNTYVKKKRMNNKIEHRKKIDSTECQDEWLVTFDHLE